MCSSDLSFTYAQTPVDNKAPIKAMQIKAGTKKKKFAVFPGEAVCKIVSPGLNTML